MSSATQNHPAKTVASQTAPQQIVCGNCKHTLPLRAPNENEHTALWHCAHCNMSFEAVCLKDAVTADSSVVRLDECYFKTNGLPPISPKQQKEASQFADRPVGVVFKERRRSRRIRQSLPLSAVALDRQFNPIGSPFRLMMVNISKEGIGLVTLAPIFADHIALELSPLGTEQIQVIVRLVREVELTPSYFEYGGEFLTRLGYNHS